MMTNRDSHGARSGFEAVRRSSGGRMNCGAFASRAGLQGAPSYARAGRFIRFRTAFGRNAASVLILTLWTLFFLASLAVAIGAHVSAGLRMAGAFKSETTSYYAARAAIERAVGVVAADTNRWDAWNEPWHGTDAPFELMAVGDAEARVYSVDKDSLGHSVTNFGLVDEESRIDINRAHPKLIEALFRDVGDLGETEAADVAAAVVEWRTADAEEQVLTEKPSNDYYATLSGPYDPHHGHFALVEELALVRGVDASLFEAVKRHVTVYGTGKVNLNTAGRVVLEALAGRWGDDPHTAGTLIEKIEAFRESGRSFESPDRRVIAKALGDWTELSAGEAALLRSMARSVQVHSEYYGGTAEGWSGVEGSAESRIRFVFDKSRRRKVYWHER